MSIGSSNAVGGARSCRMMPIKVMLRASSTTNTSAGPSETDICRRTRSEKPRKGTAELVTTVVLPGRPPDR